MNHATYIYTRYVKQIMLNLFYAALDIATSVFVNCTALKFVFLAMRMYSLMVFIGVKIFEA